MKSVLLSLFACLLLCLSSCKDKFNQIISKENIQQIILEAKSDPSIDTTKVQLLENLHHALLGRDSFVKRRVTLDSDLSWEKYITKEEEFKKATEDLFLYFQSQNVTYRQMFMEADSMKAIFERKQVQLAQIYQVVDSICLAKQKALDDKDAELEKIKERLNKMVEISLVSIEETEEDYRDIIRVAIRMVNKTNMRIEALSFDLELTDKLGTKVATLGCRTNSGFTKSDVGYWNYDKWERDDVYKSLKNLRASQLTGKQSIDAINLGGEIITAKRKFENFEVDYDYETSKPLTGYCPYLEKDDPLLLKIKSTNDDLERESKNRFIHLSRYQQFLNSLFSF